MKSENVFRDYPKGGRQHSHKIPLELLQRLREARKNAKSELVVVPPKWKMLDYWNFLKVLKKRCQRAEVPEISTHGLRHSSSELWMKYGATRDDLRILFAHTDSSTTDRYVHDKGSRLHEVAKVLELFPQKSNGLAVAHEKNDPKMIPK